MHPAAYRAVERAVRTHTLNQEGYSVAEIGSYDVNGSVRPLFDAAAEYIGVDVRPGPGVDEVADGGRWGSAETFDVVVTTETMEHAESPKRIITNAARILKPGGWLIVTAAAPGRGAHSVDGTAPQPGDVYQNIAPDDLAEWLEAAGFVAVAIEHNTADCDVYAVAQKSEAS